MVFTHTITFIRPAERLIVAWIPNSEGRGGNYSAARIPEQVTTVASDIVRCSWVGEPELVAHKPAGRFLRAAWSQFVNEQVATWASSPVSEPYGEDT